MPRPADSMSGRRQLSSFLEQTMFPHISASQRQLHTDFKCPFIGFMAQDGC